MQGRILQKLGRVPFDPGVRRLTEPGVELLDEPRLSKTRLPTLWTNRPSARTRSQRRSSVHHLVRAADCRPAPEYLQRPCHANVSAIRLSGKMAHDDLVCPPSVSACGHPARRLALFSFHAQLSRRRRSARGARPGCLLRDGAAMGFEVRTPVRPRTSASDARGRPRSGISMRWP